MRKNSNNNNLKYTCRYEIPIDNDKEFFVAKKIIGSDVIFYKIL